MAKMRVGKEKNGFKIMDEGVTILKITECEDKYDDFKKVSYTFSNSSGTTFKKTFTFVTKNEINETVKDLWTTLTRRALNLPKDEEPDVEFSDLVGTYVKGYVKHNTYTVQSGEHAGEERTNAELDIWSKEFPLENAFQEIAK